MWKDAGSGGQILDGARKNVHLLSTELETGEVYERISYQDIAVFLCISSSVHCADAFIDR